MSPHVPGYATSPVQLPLGKTFGAVTIGVWASCIFFGMNFLSTIHYIGRFPQDPLHNKLLVGALSVVNIIYIAAQCEMVYNWTVAQWGNIVVLENTSWGWQGAVGGLSSLALIVQYYFAFRIWVLSGRKGWWICIIIILLSTASFGFAMGTIYVTTRFSPGQWGFYTYGNTSWLSCAAAADTVITVSMIYYLLKARTGFRATERLIKTWIIHALETNAITAVGAIIEAIFVAISAVNTDNSLIYVGLAYAVTQLYPLSVLTALNSRTGLAADRVHTGQLSGLTSNGVQNSLNWQNAPNGRYPFKENTSIDTSGNGTDTFTVTRATKQDVHVLSPIQTGGQGEMYDHERDGSYQKHAFNSEDLEHVDSSGRLVYVRDLEKGAPQRF